MDSVEFVNAVEISKEDLLAIAADVAEHHHEEDTFEIAMYCIAARFKRQPRKAGAAFMRMQALARYVGDMRPAGWTLPQLPDGSIPTQEAVFAAAAVHPLTASGNQLVFEPESFLDRILGVAEAEGQA